MRFLWLLALFLAGSLCQARTTNAFFNQFNLRPAEVPAGFELVPTRGEKNPLLMSGDSVWAGFLYVDPDRAAISQALAAVYGKDTDHALGVYSIEYRSAAALQNEVAKLHRNDARRFLWKDRYLVIIWSGGDGLGEQLDKLTGQLQQRLGLDVYVPVPSQSYCR